MKYRKALITVSILLLTFLLGRLWYTYYINSIHSSINISDVESIKIWGPEVKGYYKIADNDEARLIVTWFNSITDIRENPDFSGSTSSSGIIISLKSKKQISIAGFGSNIEVQRYNSKGKWISYFGKQQDLQKVLKDADDGSKE